jgi:hypothetical protein
MKETGFEPKSSARRRQCLTSARDADFFFSLVSYLALGKNLSERIPGWEFLGKYPCIPSVRSVVS